MNLSRILHDRLGAKIKELVDQNGELTLTLSPDDVQEAVRTLRDAVDLGFEQLIDLCGVDYLHYGVGEWATESASTEGFGRGVQPSTSAHFTFHDAPRPSAHQGPRFAVVYHLLSISHNWRLRVKVFCADDEFPRVPSVTDVWAVANWFEREAFDLFGILFDGHPDLRRLLTDYGFVGHPFRKDFPLIGHVEMRYDSEQQRVIYEPVSIEPRVLVPKVIRRDNRYAGEGTQDA
ncbi:NADH-ubiquinone oxidoreductase chain C [Acidihalobacter prosperus]|uniref:NADH-quinone oxidoreductase subunit C n=2 Tax=Acidihalobacter prosperus TaxID=160660 RepID=A0A1A6C709_9GAMM|nr:NADH-quinone oxidoreductase subunit C [Acidihalobacter prosperus]OBS10346.1 NADH-ubiquinone oxidoreductase chain C [Acidihalobacter prosperus]